jgi:hypothetical protein
MRMQDTFRGRVCECPIVRGVKFVGDGYTHCEGTLNLFLHYINISYNGKFSDQINDYCYLHSLFSLFWRLHHLQCIHYSFPDYYMLQILLIH